MEADVGSNQKQKAYTTIDQSFHHFLNIIHFARKAWSSQFLIKCQSNFKAADSNHVGHFK